MRRLASVAALVGTVALTTAALAHHSAAMFDRSREVVITGTVKEIQWTHPHAWFQIDVPDANGKKIEWSFETEGPNLLTRAGIKRNTFTVGEKVTIHAHPLRDGRPAGMLISLTKSDGSVWSLRPDLRKPAT